MLRHLHCDVVMAAGMRVPALRYNLDPESKGAERNCRKGEAREHSFSAIISYFSTRAEIALPTKSVPFPRPKSTSTLQHAQLFGSLASGRVLNQPSCSAIEPEEEKKEGLARDRNSPQVLRPGLHDRGKIMVTATAGEHASEILPGHSESF